MRLSVFALFIFVMTLSAGASAWSQSYDLNYVERQIQRYQRNVEIQRRELRRLTEDMNAYDYIREQYHGLHRRMRRKLSHFGDELSYWEDQRRRMFGRGQGLSGIPADIQSVDITVRNVALTGGCPARFDQCYRMFVKLNGRAVAVWMTSPGKPHRDGGVYTTEFTNAKVTRMEDGNYKSRTYPKKTNGGAPMPWAIFFNNTTIAIHGSDRVTGERESYGCLRISPANAERLHTWVNRAGRQNVRLTVRDTVESKDSVRQFFY